jgi:hypothetical protein
MNGRFVILDQGVLTIYNRYEDIPAVFDHIIEFFPDFPAGPHTDQEHQDLHDINDKLQNLVRRERASSDPSR